jgi:hypothetical protein
LAIEKFGSVVTAPEQQQLQMQRHVLILYRMALAAFSVIVISLSFLVIMLAFKIPQMAGAVANINRYFAEIVVDMSSMRRTMANMDTHVKSLPPIIADIDRINGSE